MKRIAVLTSGGDSPGMNACLRSVFRTANNMGIELVGVRRGYAGLVDGDMFVMTKAHVGNILQTGGTILKTSRSAEFMTEAGFKKAVMNLKKNKIEGLVVIGGDGSMNGALKLAGAGVDVVCVPGTIDNDLGFTDMTLGFDTACGTVVNLVNNIRDTSLSHDRVSVIEVMGAFSGDIALYSGLASGADIVLVPEVPYTVEQVAQRLISNDKNGKSASIVIVNEKACSAPALANSLASYGIDARPLVLGHIQRGGSPSYKDRNLGAFWGNMAVKLIASRTSNVAVGIRNGKHIVVPLEKALKEKKKFDKETYELINYLSL